MPVSVERRRIAQEYVARRRAETVCSRCGKQPIEWHRREHEDNHYHRVSQLATHGATIERIEQEIALCDPLCRSCHMRADGRLERLQVARPRQKGDVIVGELPCDECGEPAKPRRKGKCRRCYDAGRPGR